MSLLASVLLSMTSPAAADDDPLAAMRAACEANPRSCGPLARELGYFGRAEAEAEVRTLYRRACDAGDVTSCVRHAQRLLTARGDAPADARTAVATLERLCRERSGEACRWVGHLSETGGGGRRESDDDAVVSYERACELDDATGCEWAADLYASGAVERADGRERARTLYTRACERGRSAACMARFVDARMAEAPVADVPAVRARAAERCAENDAEACDVLGTLAFAGAGGPRDFGLAATSFRDACARSHARACGRLGMLFLLGHGVHDSLEHARALLEYACAARVGPACYSLVEHFDEELSAGEQIALTTRACEAGVGDGCTWAVSLRHQAGEAASSFEPMIERGCALGSGTACFWHARATYARGLPRDLDEISRTFREACVRGAADAC